MISSTSATITRDGDWQVLTWDISIAGAGTQTVSYGFDAPDISPYLYNLGAASIEGDVTTTKDVTVSTPVESTASSTASSTDTASTTTTTTQVSTTDTGTVFQEHRQWQIASDATGSLL
jgi:hypothetical protein